ncbi:MAG: hypothetical protein ABH843_08075 [Candidatus Omnitrophota bacterium]
MEMELKSLIDQIKKDGIEQAEKDAQGIIAKSEDKASQIIKEAQGKKQQIIKEAENTADGLRRSSEEAIKQSGRDALLTLREKVTDFFNRVLKAKVSEQLSPDLLKEVILKVVENCQKEGALDIEVVLSKDDKNNLEKVLFKALTEEAKKSLTLVGKQGIDKGFRIGEKGKDSYLDFTDDALAEAFKRYLNPRLAEMLNIDLGLNKEN